jgi:hypothetical protein
MADSHDVGRNLSTVAQSTSHQRDTRLDGVGPTINWGVQLRTDIFADHNLAEDLESL